MRARSWAIWPNERRSGGSFRGLADKLLGGQVAQTIEYRLNGVVRVFELAGDDASEGRFCTQQMPVHSLLHELIDGMGGDVRFDVTDVALHNEGGPTGGHLVGCKRLTPGRMRLHRRV